MTMSPMPDDTANAAEHVGGAVVIVGGYGVVGAQIVQMMSRRHPGLPLVVAGRSLEKAADCARAFTSARGMRIDVSEGDPLAGLPDETGIVVAAVNDPANALMRAAIRRGIPYLDITHWTERLLPAVVEATALAPRAPVVFASSWMAGVPGLIAAHLAGSFGSVDRIDLSILYALKDKAGPNSVEYADRLAEPFRVFEDGRWVAVKPLSGAKVARFPGGASARTHRFSTPDGVILPYATGARSVGVRITYDDPGTTRLMAFLIRSGIWNAISGPWFKALRHALLYNPGPGAPHEVVIEIEGRDAAGEAGRIEASIRDPQGQTHLTALGAVAQIECILGLSGTHARSTGVSFAETDANAAWIIAFLRSEGVEIAVSTDRR